MKLFKERNIGLTIEQRKKLEESKMEFRKKALDNIENFSFILPFYEAYKMIDYLGTQDYEFIGKEPRICDSFCQDQPGMVEIRKRKI